MLRSKEKEEGEWPGQGHSFRHVVREGFSEGVVMLPRSEKKKRSQPYAQLEKGMFIPDRGKNKDDEPAKARSLEC